MAEPAVHLQCQWITIKPVQVFTDSFHPPTKRILIVS